MKTTKDDILKSALELFASYGYEAVSVSMISGKIGITKGALYKHYRSKRDIFDSILRKMENNDYDGAARHDMPQGTPEETTEEYKRTSVENFISYSRAQFVYWTENEFACLFRKMLTVEQFRSYEMNDLYQKYLYAGPLRYVCDIFTAMKIDEPYLTALGFYSPMTFLYTVYDSEAERETAKKLAAEHFTAQSKLLVKKSMKNQ